MNVYMGEKRYGSPVSHISYSNPPNITRFVVLMKYLQTARTRRIREEMERQEKAGTLPPRVKELLNEQ